MKKNLLYLLALEMNHLQIGTGCRTFRFRLSRIFQLYEEGLHGGDNGSGCSRNVLGKSGYIHDTGWF